MAVNFDSLAEGLGSYGYPLLFAAVFAENVFVFADCIDSNSNSSIYAAFTPNAALGLHAMWTWQPLGLPPGSPGVSLLGAAASIEIEPTLASVQMFVFAENVGSGSSEVYTCRWDGSAWSWHDQQRSLARPKQHALQQLRRQVTQGQRKME